MQEMTRGKIRSTYHPESYTCYNTQFLEKQISSDYCREYQYDIGANHQPLSLHAVQMHIQPNNASPNVKKQIASLVMLK